MKKNIIFSFLVSAMTALTSNVFAQDMAINIATQELSVAQGDTGTILVQITNNSFTTACAIGKLRPLVSIPPHLAIIPTAPSLESGFGNNVDNWAVVVNNGIDFRVTNTQEIPPLTSSTYYIKYIGTAVAPVATFSATLFFNGPQTVGNNTQNDVSNSSITVTTPVPITLASFSVQEKSCSMVELNWKTAKEDNFSHFEVEYSNEGKKFTTVAKVVGRNAAFGSEYAITVPQNTIQGFYRLKSVDFDNTHSYSDVSKVNLNCLNSKLELSPNPTQGIANITNLKGTETIQVLDMAGRVLLSQPGTPQKTQIDLTKFSSGVYNVLIIDGDNIVSLKLVKN